jgi:hypothetical protein
MTMEYLVPSTNRSFIWAAGPIEHFQFYKPIIPQGPGLFTHKMQKSPQRAIGIGNTLTNLLGSTYISSSGLNKDSRMTYTKAHTSNPATIPAILITPALMNLTS